MEEIYGPLHDAVISFGAKDLFDYLKLHDEWTIDVAREALSDRRKWAQGQRANPKFSVESTWFIRNSSGISEIIEAPTAYMEFVQTLGGGGREPEFVDHYKNLGVSPSASVAEIELAHRQSYRETRTLLQSADTHQIYKVLDEAWAVLSNPQARSAYDVKHRGTAGLDLAWDPADGHQRRAEGFLGPHGDQDTHLAFEFSGEEDLRRQVVLGPNYRFDKDKFTMEISSVPTSFNLSIEKLGSGQQPARLFSDARWLRVSPSHIDPAATSQKIKLTSAPHFMIKNRSLAKITLETADKQRIHVSVTGKRETFSSLSRWVLSFAIVFFGGVMLWINQGLKATSLQTELELSVTPAATTIYINGQNMGGGSIRTFTEIPHDSPFSVVIESPNFETWRRQVIVNEGDAKTIEVNLQRVEE